MEAKVLRYKEGEDPKAVITEAIGNALNDVTVYGNRVLVATAPHCERSKGGILFTDGSIDENKYQGKVGLILKFGEGAFKYDGSYEWIGAKPVVGSWVFYRTPDSWECGLNGISCRFIRDEYIVGEVAAPNTVW
jgi:co-chaperonin GroES (HSP10)